MQIELHELDIQLPELQLIKANGVQEELMVIRNSQNKMENMEQCAMLIMNAFYITTSGGGVNQKKEGPQDIQASAGHTRII